MFKCDKRPTCTYCILNNNIDWMLSTRLVFLISTKFLELTEKEIFCNWNWILTFFVVQDFICPLCMKSFGSPGELQSHFDQIHETENDSAVVSCMHYCGQTVFVCHFCIGLCSDLRISALDSWWNGLGPSAQALGSMCCILVKFFSVM